MGFPILVRRHLYIESAPSPLRTMTWPQQNKAQQYHLCTFYGMLCRDYFVYVPSQWETLYCNVVSHWLGVYTIRSLALLAQPWSYVLFGRIHWCHCDNLLENCCISNYKISSILRYWRHHCTCARDDQSCASKVMEMTFSIHECAIIKMQRSSWLCRHQLHWRLSFSL